jgi:uncharacterized protein YprB with RNaseH-like and TPR domain
MARMGDDSLRSRLEALNRAPLPASAGVIQRAASAVRSIATAPIRKTVESRSTPLPTGTPPKTCPIGGLLRGGREVETPFGPHWQVDLRLDALWQNGGQLLAARQEFLRSIQITADAAVEPTVVMDLEFAAFVGALPDRTIALDLETCGLAGAALFLIGLLRQVEGVPVVQLLLARNYAEEAAVLATLWSIVADHEVLLTFNGKSFDWPMVIERSIRHRLQPPPQGERWMHIDILHHARRRWRGRLPNCRLQTLERHVCLRTRAADIPGHAIPGVYADYVRTGFERDMDTVLYHNALDLVTLFDLAHRLAA